MLPEFYQFQHPTKMIYGEGLASDFSHELAGLNEKKYFMVSDHVINDLGLLKKIKEGIEEGGISITGQFLDVPQDASIEAVEAISKQATETGAEGLMAVGGGSVIDATKAANFTFSHGGDFIEDYSGAGILTEPLKPFVVIPTTAGTGSESTLAALIYDAKNKVKLAFSDSYLLPDLAVLDPMMTKSLPPGLTASTGMDALTHAVESYVGIDTSPHSEALAVAAIELILKNLVRSTENGDDLEARGAMLIASNMAGTSFSHSMVGCVHSMAHATGGLFRVPHGIANAIFLPHGMEYNFEECKERYAKLAYFMGEDVSGLSVDDAAKKAIQAVRNLTKKLNKASGIPINLKDAGKKTCFGCSVACKKEAEVKDGPFKMKKGPAPEYETVVTFGTMCLNASIESVAKANEICNRYGMDTISCGSTIAFAIECFENGLISQKDTDGLDLKWGNSEAIIAMAEKIGKKEGLGAVLAQGSARAAEHIGGNASEFLTTVKGLEAPMHDPRSAHGYGLAYAVSPRGACHEASLTWVVEGGAMFIPEIPELSDDLPEGSEGRARLNVVAQDYGMFFSNCAIFCNLGGSPLNATHAVDMVNHVTGFDYTIDDVMKIGRKVWYLKRGLTNLFGARASEDRLPKRLMTPMTEGPSEGSVPDMDLMLKEFYEMRGLDEDGIPGKEVLTDLGLDELAELLSRKQSAEL